MIVTETDYQTILDLLPPEADNISWDEYEAFLQEFAEQPHIRHQQISGKKRLDLAVDPPPDLAIKVDITNHSTNKFSIYADLEVPERWRLNGGEVNFYELVDEDYVRGNHSRLFPFLTPDSWLGFLQVGETQGAVVRANKFRAWEQANKA